MAADHWECVCGAVRALTFCSWVGATPPCPECAARRPMRRVPDGYRIVTDPATGASWIEAT